jgi:RNA recognition motif-containing protein
MRLTKHDQESMSYSRNSQGLVGALESNRGQNKVLSYGSNMKLLIRNLARNTTEAELQSLFDAFGAVQSCDLVLDKKSGNSKGFAFVQMPKHGEARAAMKALNGKELDGNVLRVKQAIDRTESKPTGDDHSH